MPSCVGVGVDERVGISVLGATGSIGSSTLDVIARHPERYRVVALSAGQSVELMFSLCQRFHPEFVALENAEAAQNLQLQLQAVSSSTQVLTGLDGQVAVATEGGADVVMSAITGAAGLRPTLAAVRAGKRVLLANKESLVMTGRLLLDEVAQCGATLLPIDSEHNAIFQCLPQQASGVCTTGVSGIVLTASGGPFRQWSLAELDAVTPAQALAHPRWQMGPKISIDSASLMNKGLEVIEASFLFDISVDDIDVVVHPQSTVHSLVRYRDGSLLAQLGAADMRIPIAHALAWPERIDSGAQALDLVALARLDFEAPDDKRFPALGLARHAAKAGGTATAILNAANEIAVQGFLDNQIPFRTMMDIVDHTLNRVEARAAHSLEAVIDADASARRVASAQLQHCSVLSS